MIGELNMDQVGYYVPLCVLSAVVSSSSPSSDFDLASFAFRVVYLDYGKFPSPFFRLRQSADMLKKKVLIEKGFVDDVVLGDLERRIDNCDNCNVVMVLLLLSLNLNYHFTIST